MDILIIGAVSTAVVTLLLLPVMRQLAFRLGAIDIPGARRTHPHVTPRLGGLAVFIGLYVGVAVIALLAVERGTMPILDAFDSWPFRAVLVVGSLFVAIGLVDDLRGLSASTKLVTEVVLAGLMFVAGVRVETLPIPGGGLWELGTFGSLIATLVWIVGVTNAFNMVDGLNGLAGGVALVTGIGMLVIADSWGALGSGVIGVLVVGAAIGFIPGNMRPRYIFLGDSGSLLLGFLLSTSSLLLLRAQPHSTASFSALLLLGLPAMELFTTIARRTLASQTWRSGMKGAWRFVRGELLRPDAGHLHHALVQKGLGRGIAALTLVLIAGAFAASGVAAAIDPRAHAAGAWAAALLALGCCGVSLADQRRQVPRESPDTARPARVHRLRPKLAEVDERIRRAA